MAGNLTITQLVNIDLVSGKINTSALEKEFPNLIQQALGKLPGGKALVGADITIDPKFNTTKVLKQLDELMDRADIKAQKGTKGFEQLEKMVAKYSASLEHLSKVSTSANFDKRFIAKAEKIATGALPATAVDPKKLDEYRNYMAELQKVWGQIQREFTHINSSVSSGDLANARKRLHTASSAAYDLQKQYDANLKPARDAVAKAEEKAATNNSKGVPLATKSAKELEAARTVLIVEEKNQAKLLRRINEKKSKAELETVTITDIMESGQGGRKIVGAHIVPEVEQVNKALKDLVRGLDEATGKLKTDGVKHTQAAEKLAAAMQRVDKTVPANLNTKADLQNEFQKRTPAQLQETLKAIAAEKSVRESMAKQGVIDEGRNTTLLMAERAAKKAMPQTIIPETQDEKNKAHFSAKVTRDSLLPTHSNRSELKRGLGQYDETRLEELKQAVLSERVLERHVASSTRRTGENKQILRDINAAERALINKEKAPEVERQQRLDIAQTRKKTNTLTQLGVGKGVDELVTQFTGAPKHTLDAVKKAVSTEYNKLNALVGTPQDNAKVQTRLKGLTNVSQALDTVIGDLKKATQAPRTKAEKAQAVVDTRAQAAALISPTLTPAQRKTFIESQDRGSLKNIRDALVAQGTAERAAKLPVAQRQTDYLQTTLRNVSTQVNRLNRAERNPERLADRAPKTLAARQAATARTDQLTGQVGSSVRELVDSLRNATRAHQQTVLQAARQERAIISRDVGTTAQTPATVARVERLSNVDSAVSQLNQERRAAERGISPDEQLRRDERAQQIRRGRQAISRVGGNLEDLNESEHRDARAALQARVVAANRNLTRVTQQFGPGAAETQAAANGLHAINGQLHQLNSLATHTHPIVDRLGQLLGRFATYAIGYGGLYKVAQAFQSITMAVVDLQDKLKTIQAVTGSSTGEMVQMSETIKQTAVTSAFSLNEITDSVQTLAQAGVELKDIPKTVSAVSTLAMATGTTLQTSADVITTAKGVWDEVDVTQISDRVAQASNVSKLVVGDLQTIFSLGAAFAKNANISLDQYMALVATMRNVGVKNSTIATGTSQLIKELFAPDEKLSQFLSSRYKKKGEDVTAEAASKKFSAFRYEENPMVAALSELKRLGVDKADALPGLSRAVDQRGMRILQPLLDNIGKLQETQGRLIAAPTAQEASKIAMESLKKATVNLVDQFNVLADTLMQGAIPGLTSLVKSTSSAVKRLDDYVSKADILTAGQKTDGTTSKVVGTLAGAAAGYSRGAGAGKILTTVAGAIGGYTGVGAVNTASANLGNSEKITNVLDGVFIAYLLSKVKGLFSVSGEGVGGLVTGRLSGLWTAGINKLMSTSLATWVGTSITRIGAALVLSPAALEVGVGLLVGAIITGTVFLLGEAALAIKDFFKSDQEKLADLEKMKDQLAPPELRKVQAKERAEREIKAKDYTRYDIGTPERPAAESSLAGKIKTQETSMTEMRQSVGLAIGNQNLTPAQDELIQSHLDKISPLGEKTPARNTAVLELQKALKGSGTPDEVALQAALSASNMIKGSLASLVESEAKRYSELIEKQHAGQLTEIDQRELDQLQKTMGASPAYADIVNGKGAGLKPDVILQTLTGLSKDLNKTVITPDDRGITDKRSYDKQELLRMYRSSVNADSPDAARIGEQEYAARLQAGVAEHGTGFGQEVVAAVNKLSTLHPAYANAIIDTPANGASLVGAGNKPLGTYSDSELKDIVGYVMPRLIHVESRGNIKAVSSAGAVGLTQILPSTAAKPGYDTTPLADPVNASGEQQVEFTRQYLTGTAKKNPRYSVKKWLSMYNMGPRNEEAAGYKIGNLDYANNILNAPVPTVTKANISNPLATNTIDIFVQDVLHRFEKDTAALTRIQDNAIEQAKILTTVGKKEGEQEISVETQSGKLVKATQAGIAAELRDSLKPAIEDMSQGGKVYDQIAAIQEERNPEKKKKLYEAAAPLIEAAGGIPARIDSGALQRNPDTGVLEVNPKNGMVRTANKYLNNDTEHRVKTEFVYDQQKDRDLELLRRQIDDLKQNKQLPKLQELGLYDKEKEFQLDKLKAQRAHIETNGYSDVEIEQRKKERDLFDNAAAQEDVKTKANKDVQQLKYQIDTDRLTTAESALKLEIDNLRNIQQAEADAGKYTEYSVKLTELEKQRVDITEKLLKLKRAHAEVTDQEVAAALKAQSLESFHAQYQAESTSLNTKFQRVSSGADFYSPSTVARQSYQQASGEAVPTKENLAFAQSQVAGFTQNQKDTEALLQKKRTELSGMSKTDEKFAALNTQIQNTQTRLLDIARALAEAKARVDEYDPSFIKEFSQISGKSIAAKLDNSPGALKNLNSNLENRSVEAVSGIGDVLSGAFGKVVRSLFGFNQATEEARQSLKDLHNAQADFAQSMTITSLDVANSITDIKANELDPVRQEYLIKRALDAQAVNQAIQAGQVANAQKDYNTVKRNESVVGQLGAVGANAAGGAAGDIIKAGVTTVFSKIFSLGGSGDTGVPRGETSDRPSFVEVTNLPDGGLGGGGGGGSGSTAPASSGGGLSSTISNVLGSAGSWISGLFGGSTAKAAAAGVDPSTPVVAPVDYGFAGTSSQAGSSNILDAIAKPVDEAATGLSADLSVNTDNMDKSLGNYFSSKGALSQTLDRFLVGAKNIFTYGGGGGGGGSGAGGMGSPQGNVGATISSASGLASSAVSTAAKAAGASASSAGGYGAIVGGLIQIAGTITSYEEGVKKYKKDMATFQSNVDAYNADYKKPPQGLATGGPVIGVGTSTSDSIPAALSHGEYVLNAKATNKIGRNTLDLWNFHHQAPLMLASGGFVHQNQAVRDAVNAPKSTPAGLPTGQTGAVGGKEGAGIRIVMVDDHRRVGDFINSPVGEKTLVDFVSRNRLSLRNILS